MAKYNVSVDGQLDIPFDKLEDAEKYTAHMRTEGFEAIIFKNEEQKMYVSCRWAREEMGRLRTKHKMTFDFNPGGGEFNGEHGRCQITTCDDVADLVTFNRWLIDKGLEQSRTIEIPYNSGPIPEGLTFKKLFERGLSFKEIPANPDIPVSKPYTEFKYRDMTNKITGIDLISDRLVVILDNWMNEVDVIKDQEKTYYGD